MKNRYVRHAHYDEKATSRLLFSWVYGLVIESPSEPMDAVRYTGLSRQTIAKEYARIAERAYDIIGRPRDFTFDDEEVVKAMSEEEFWERRKKQHLAIPKEVFERFRKEYKGAYDKNAALYVTLQRGLKTRRNAKDFASIYKWAEFTIHITNDFIKSAAEMGYEEHKAITQGYLGAATFLLGDLEENPL